MALPRYTTVDATQPGITDLPEDQRPRRAPAPVPVNPFQALIDSAGTPSSPSTTGSSGGGGGTLPPSAPPPTQSTAPAPAASPVAYETMGNIQGVRMPDGGWMPLDNPAAQAYIASQPGQTTPSSTPTTGPAPITIPPVTADTSVTQTGPGTPVTTGGNTVTIPEPPAIDTTPTVGDAPAANTPALTYSPEDPMMAVVREQLLALMGRSTQPVSLEDPTLKPQADANYAAQERSRRDLMEQTAARYGAQGLGSSGAMDTAMRQGYEDVGQNVGEFNAGLISEEQGARRQDLKDALDMANELGMFKEKTKLERDLATLDTETKLNIANQVAQLENTKMSLQDKLGTFDLLLKQYGIDLQGDLGLLNMVMENEFNYDELNLRGQIANMDDATKRTIAQMDADLRQQGLSTQERLAALDAEVRRYGIDTQGDLGRLEVALRKELGLGQLNLGLLQTILGNQLGYDQLGWDMAQWGADQNANIADYL